MTRQDYSHWEEVPEEQIIEAAKTAENMGGPGAPDNVNFRKVLMAGTKFKEAGLTPVYVWCDQSHRLAVYAQETYGKRLH